MGAKNRTALLSIYCAIAYKETATHTNAMQTGKYRDYCERVWHVKPMQIESV